MHLIDKHMFPKSYDFFIVNTGIDKRSSMLRTRHRRTSSAASRSLQRDKNKQINGTHRSSESSNSEQKLESQEATNCNEAAKNVKSKESDMDELTSTMSALRFVPSSVRFGRGGPRRGFSRS